MVGAVLHEAGTPRFGESAEPVATDGQVVVDVGAAGLNPVDLLLADGLLPGYAMTFPAVVGHEGVGRLADGRRVYWGRSVAPFGSMAERALVASEELFDVPDGVDDVHAVGVGIAGLAAWLALSWRARLEPGETVLVLGATGAVGSIAVQVARLLGAGRVVAAGRRPVGLERALARGADAAVQLTGDMVAALAEALPGGADVIVDTVWGAPAEAALKAAPAVGARYIQVGNSAGLTSQLAAPVLRSKGLSFLAHGGFIVPREARAEAYGRVAGHLAAGEIEIDVEALPLTEVEAAWERQRQGPGAKLVLVP